MGSKRQEQVAEIIKRNFGMVLVLEGSIIYGDALVSVTNVVISPDFGYAKIYLSIFNAEDKTQVLDLISKNSNRLKNSLAQRIKKQVRRIPNIRFYLDDLVDEMYSVNSLLDNLNIKNDE